MGDEHHAMHPGSLLAVICLICTSLQAADGLLPRTPLVWDARTELPGLTKLTKLPPAPIPSRRIQPEDVVRESVRQVIAGANITNTRRFAVFWTYTEAEAKAIMDALKN